MTNDNKYGGRGRNLWRKSYGYHVNKPQVVAFVDTATNTTRSIDLNKLARHRDFYYIDGTIGTTGSAVADALAQYDEGLFSINSSGEPYTGSFNITFTSNPYVVLTVESASQWGENLNVFGYSYSTTGVVIGLSAPFVGTVRYRAIYSDTYPANATSPYTASIVASAGSASLSYASTYTASFAALPGAPFLFAQTAWDTSNRGDADVALLAQTSGSTTATVEISSPFSSEVHYIAFY